MAESDYLGLGVGAASRAGDWAGTGILSRVQRSGVRGKNFQPRNSMTTYVCKDSMWCVRDTKRKSV